MTKRIARTCSSPGTVLESSLQIRRGTDGDREEGPPLARLQPEARVG